MTTIVQKSNKTDQNQESSWSSHHQKQLTGYFSKELFYPLTRVITTFVVFNNEFKDGFTLTKRWIWIHYPTDHTTKHMQIFNVLKTLTFLFSFPPSPKQKNHRKEASFRNQDILLEPRNLDPVLGFDSGSLYNLGHVSKLNC